MEEACLLAINKNDVELLESIITTTSFDIDTPIDKYRNTCLHVAGILGNHDVIKLMLKNKANPNIPNDSNQHVYDIVCNNGDIDGAYIVTHYGGRPCF